MPGHTSSTSRDRPPSSDTQRARDQRRRVRAQHLGRRHVPRVARVARDGIGGVAERVVVVVQRDDARAAVDATGRSATHGSARRRCRRRCAAARAHLAAGSERSRTARARASSTGVSRETDTGAPWHRAGRGCGMPPGRRRRVELRLRAHPTAPMKGPGAEKSLRTRRGHAAHRSGWARHGANVRDLTGRSTVKPRRLRATRPRCVGATLVDELRDPLLDGCDHRVDHRVDVDALRPRATCAIVLPSFSSCTRSLRSMPSACAAASSSVPTACRRRGWRPW